jgi:hypothetical protein
MFAAGVVEVLAGGKDLHGLGARSGGEFQQARVQALVEKQVRGENAQHDWKITPHPADSGSSSAGTLIVSFFEQVTAADPVAGTGAWAPAGTAGPRTQREIDAARRRKSEEGGSVGGVQAGAGFRFKPLASEVQGSHCSINCPGDPVAF